ncbi:MAG TPA: SdpI family protein [Thermoanaerobaculia bacterium]|nr:SdpI family protein [Thermoanaerobaculia bacterium]
MKRSDVLGLLLVLGAAAITAVLYPALPDPMPSHWNAAGEVNGWMPKFWGAALVPLIMAFIWLMFLVLPRISPRGFEMEPFLRAWGVFKVMLLAVMLFISVIVLRAAQAGGKISMTAVFVALGLLFVVLGNLLGKVTRNFFVGIRTPWTLASEEVWYRTHRLAGKLFVISGTAVIAAAVIGLSMWPIFAAIMLAALIPVVYSYVLYRRLEGLPGTRPAA